MDKRDEIRAAIKRAITNLKTLADRTPTAPVKGDDFNMLLASAKQEFPSLATVQGLKPVEGGTNMGELMLKLSFLEGAIQSDFDARIVADSERLNRESSMGEFFDTGR